jgi:hypothetical protein
MDENENNETASERMRGFAANARLAVKIAQIENPDASGMAGIGWKRADGTGKLVADFDSEPFCDDIDAVLAELDRLRAIEAAASKYLDATEPGVDLDDTDHARTALRSALSREVPR